MNRYRVARGLLVFALTAAALPVLAGGVALRGILLSDNGDHDGFADTRERVSLRLTVQNTSGVALTGVSASISTPDGLLACPTKSTLSIGDLAVGEIKLTTDFFEFLVTDVDRATLALGPQDPLSVTFEVGIESSPAQVAHPSEIKLDLDLDASGGGAPATLFESFENTLGAFEVDNMDQDLHSLQAADGWRCQASDPGAPNSHLDGFPQLAATCYPGQSQAHADQVFWGLSGPAFSPLGGRAFTGFHSLFFGIDLGPPANWTTPLGVLEAVRTTDPIALGHGSPMLSFKHQTRLFNGSIYGATDRGVVMVQLADDSGNPAGNWIKLDAFQNPEDSPVSTNIANCLFDPTDDGSTEDEFFVPIDPERRYGPSSTCNGEAVFTRQGDTDEPFAPDKLGLADGPGLAGAWGIGTWVEVQYDLGRFKGRQIRVRFVTSSPKDPNHQTWDSLSSLDNPVEIDDGWWIDDVRIEGALDVPAIVVVDNKDNSGLPGGNPDGDTDGVGDSCDNCTLVANGDQSDYDEDGAGNVCDPCQLDAFDDGDADGHCADVDNCPALANVDQADGDTDTVGDSCDNCPDLANATQFEADGDGSGFGCDCDDNDPDTHPQAPEINDGDDNQCPGDLGYGVEDEISGLVGFLTPGDKTR